MVEAKDIIPSAIEGALIAGAFIVLGMLTAFLNGAFALSIEIWTIVTMAILLPLIGLKMRKVTLQTIIGLGLSVAIIGIIALFIPEAAFLFAPFTTSISSIVGLIAVVMQLGAAMVIADIVKKAVGK
jgi:hypothetical protein